MIGIVCAFFHTEGKGFYSRGYEPIEKLRVGFRADAYHDYP